MHLEAIYKKETGKDSMYEKKDPGNCNRSDLYYYDSYVEWLEDKLIQANKALDSDAKEPAQVS